VGTVTSLFKALKNVADKIQDSSQELEALAEEYRGKNDDFLKQKMKESLFFGKTLQKMAAHKVFRERYPLPNDEKT